MMPYGQQTQELTITAFPLSQVVVAMAVVVSTVLETVLSSAVLLRTAAPTPGAASCTAALAMCTGTPTPAVSRSVLPSAASGIDYLTICGLADAGGRKGGLGGIPPNGCLLVLKTLKINKYGISRRPIPYPRRGDACIVL